MSRLILQVVILVAMLSYCGGVETCVREDYEKTYEIGGTRITVNTGQCVSYIRPRVILEYKLLMSNVTYREPPKQRCCQVTRFVERSTRIQRDHLLYNKVLNCGFRPC
ncbi:uncharacterized protein LOC144353288 [Saccoglossus kowalevskii]